MRTLRSSRRPSHTRHKAICACRILTASTRHSIPEGVTMTLSAWWPCAYVLRNQYLANTNISTPVAAELLRQGMSLNQSQLLDIPSEWSHENTICQRLELVYSAYNVDLRIPTALARVLNLLKTTTLPGISTHNIPRSSMPDGHYPAKDISSTQASSSSTTSPIGIHLPSSRGALPTHQHSNQFSIIGARNRS
jgi:hypothetical protein